MAPAKTFHRFPDLPPEIQLMIWKVPLEAGYVLEHQEQSGGDITLTPLTWDYSALRETCVDAARTIQKSCKLVTLPDPIYCVGPEGEQRIKLWLDPPRTTIHFLTPPRVAEDDSYPLLEFLDEQVIKYVSFTWGRMSEAAAFCAMYKDALFEHLKLNVFVYAQSTGKPRRNDDMPPPSEMAEGIESRELTEDGQKGLVDIKTASNRKFVALTEKEFDVVRESMEGHIEVLESLLIYQEGYPDGVYSFRATFCSISYLAGLRLRAATDD
ncbi:hypothetical protein LQW54_005187 [Pestalotiopsis sp. IQ-011]